MFFYLEVIPDGVRNVENVHYVIDSFYDLSASEQRVQKKLDEYRADLEPFGLIFAVLELVYYRSGGSEDRHALELVRVQMVDELL